MSGTLVYDPDYFQQVILSYSGSLNLNEYTNPSGVKLEAFLASSGSQDLSYISYSSPSGTLIFDTPLALSDETQLNSFKIETSLQNSVVTTNLVDTLVASGSVDLTQNVVSGLLDTALDAFTDATQLSLIIKGQEQLQEYLTPGVSGNFIINTEISFGSVDSRDSGVLESDSVSLLIDLQDSSYQTIIPSTPEVSGNLLFTSDIDLATFINVQIFADSGTGVFDAANIQTSLIGQDGLPEANKSLYQEILDPPIELYFSDIISGVGDVEAIQFFPINQTADNVSLFGDSDNQVGFSIFSASVSGVISDVEKIESILDSYFNVSLRFNIPLTSFGGIQQDQTILLDSYAFPTARLKTSLDTYARFTKDEVIYRKKVWNPSSLPLEGKLLRVLFDDKGQPLIDIVQQYFVQPLGVTKKDGKFLLTDFPEGAVWEIDPFSGKVRDYLYRIGPPVDITEHEGSVYFTSIVFQGSVMSSNGKFTGIYLQDLGFFPSAIRSYKGKLYIMQPEAGTVWDITSPANVFPVVTVPANLTYDFKFFEDRLYILDAVSSEKFLSSNGSDINSTLYSVNLTTKAVRVEFFGSLKIPGVSSSGYSILAFEPTSNGFYYSDLGNTSGEEWAPGGVGFVEYSTGSIKRILSAVRIGDIVIEERKEEDFLPILEAILSQEGLSIEEQLSQLKSARTNFDDNIRKAKVLLPFQIYNDNGAIHIVDMGIGYGASSEFFGGEGFLGPQNSPSRFKNKGGVDKLIDGLGFSIRDLNEGGGGGGIIFLGSTVNPTFEVEDGFIDETVEASLDELLAQRYPWLGFDNVDVLLDIFKLNLFFEGSANSNGLNTFDQFKGLGLEDLPTESELGFGLGSDSGSDPDNSEPPAPIKISDLLIDITNIRYVFDGDEDPDLSGDALPFPSFEFALISDGKSPINVGGGGGGLGDLEFPTGSGLFKDNNNKGLNLLRDPGGGITFNIIKSYTDLIRYVYPLIFLSRRKRRKNRPWNFTTSSAIDRSGKGVYMYQVPPFKKSMIKSLKVCFFDRTLPLDGVFSLVAVTTDIYAPPPLNATIAEVRELAQDDLRNESPDNITIILKDYPISSGGTVILDNLGLIQDLSRVYVVSQQGLWMSFDMVFEEYPDYFSKAIIDFAEQSGIFNSEILYTLDEDNSYRAG